MSRDSRKTERHRLKRKHKKLEKRREQSRTALQRLAAEGGSLECWINPDWREQGIASLQVLGQAASGRWASAGFLLDFGCLGLKDAFGRGDINEQFYRANSLEPWIEQVDAVRLDPTTARRLVAGAVRFSRQNGFRLPPAWDKWVSIFGRDILNEIPTADLSDFGVDDGLHYVGTLDFLRKRLIGCTAEEFLARPDVHWVMDADSLAYGSGLEEDEEDFDEDDLPDEEELEPLREALDDAASRLASETRKWCEQKQVAPEPLLHKAAFLTLGTLVPLGIESAQDDEKLTEDTSEVADRVNAIVAMAPPDERQPLKAAIDQVLECVRDRGGASAILEAAGPPASAPDSSEQ